MSSSKKENEKSLPDERYDAKLFKQAYKAAKKAKEIEKIERKHKIVIRSVICALVIGIFLFALYWILSSVKPKSEYILTGTYPKQTYLSDIEVKDIEPRVVKEEFNSEISALSAVVFNPSSGEVLYKKDEVQQRSIASLTKIISAIVVVETFSLDENIKVSRLNIPENLDWQLELEENDIISIENILKAMLISSYNDAPYIIANAYPYGGYEGFVLAMNEKAYDLRMFNSNFSNPAGIDQNEHYSTALDVALMVSAALKYEDILEIVSLGKDVINWSRGGEVMSKEIFTTNQLYGVNPYSKGLKTGITKLAKQCFVGYFEYPNGNDVITVVLGSEDRFVDTVLLEKYARNILK